MAQILDVSLDALNCIPLKAIVAQEGNHAVVRLTDPVKELGGFAPLDKLAVALTEKIHEVIKKIR